MREHKKLCSQHKTTRIDMPKENDNKLQFKNTKNQTEMPIVVYADFESMLKPVHSCENNPEKSSSHVVNEQKLMSYCYQVKCNLPLSVCSKLPTKPVLYRAKNESDDVGKHFLESLKKLALTVSDIYSLQEPMIELTDEQKIFHAHAQNCYLCHKPFTKENHKTRDHDHLTGFYRGPSCNNCNLKNRKQMVLPIFFHNLTNYDADLLVRKLECLPGDIEVIPNTEEQYISFTKRIHNIACRFLDSYRFLQEGLAQLANNLPENKFFETNSYFEHQYNPFEQKQKDLVTQKCYFPYEYIDSLQRLEETELPSKEKFYSKLT
jgi:hypothetical protein